MQFILLILTILTFSAFSFEKSVFDINPASKKAGELIKEKIDATKQDGAPLFQQGSSTLGDYIIYPNGTVVYTNSCNDCWGWWDYCWYYGFGAIAFCFFFFFIVVIFIGLIAMSAPTGWYGSYPSTPKTGDKLVVQVV